MKQKIEDEELGRFISLILRHKPETINIALDVHGWANVDELIKGLNKAGKTIDLNDLERIVNENNKQRYSFNDSKTKIRANQGHSINVDVELEEKIPPQYLYHGTADRFIGSIMDMGIQKQSRQYVHLSSDYDAAYLVGKRHGRPVVLKINSMDMYESKYKFYLSKNGVWLTDTIPTKYITIERERSSPKLMNINIKELTDDLFLTTAKMITELMNYHRKLNNAPKEYWQTDEESKEDLQNWRNEGTVYSVFLDNEPIGFFYVRFGGQNVAWLEDIFILEEYRGNGIGKFALKKLDELMIEKKVGSMFVDVIPRNTSAIKLYKDCGFDHLNLIQLRKNYDKKLDKNDEVNLLGFNFKKY